MAPLAAVVFVAAGSWHVGAGQVHACPGVPASRCVQVASWASTVRWRDCAGCLPHRTIATLPPDGVALQVFISREQLVGKPFLVWPPRIRTQDISGIEGVSNHYGVYQRFARVGLGEDAYVWAFFGRAHPTPAQFALANAELATTRVR
jgi:hypothetical protein